MPRQKQVGLAPDLPRISRKLGGMSSGERVFIAALVSFYNTHVSQELLRRASVQGLADLSILDLQRRQMLPHCCRITPAGNAVYTRVSLYGGTTFLCSGATMDDLNYTLRQLCQRNRDGSHTTQADRQRALTLVARQLREGGFKQMTASSLKGKHVQALPDRWQSENLASGTMKNRLSHLRWWAEKIGKAGILPADNNQLGVADRRFVTNVSKAQELGLALSLVTDAHVRMSLQLQAAFGLRREEAIKLQPAYADRGDHITLKDSWTKGGRERRIPITTAAQREVLREAHRLAGTGTRTHSDCLHLSWTLVIHTEFCRSGRPR